MKQRAWMWWVLSGAMLSLALAIRLRTATGGPAAGPVAEHRGPVRELLSVVPFAVDEPFTHAWRKEKPLVSAGYLLVLSVDPQYVRPRETAEPVLYAGDQTIERVNHGFESGRVVAILPAERRPDGRLSPEVTAIPFWFGAPDLPERVDADHIQIELRHAGNNGVRRFTPEEVALARARGGEALTLTGREDLEARAGLLVLEHAPDERDLAVGWLVPKDK